MTRPGWTASHRPGGASGARRERAGQVLLPSASDMRFSWVHADLAELRLTEACELVVDAWRMVVPLNVS